MIATSTIIRPQRTSRKRGRRFLVSISSLLLLLWAACSDSPSGPDQGAGRPAVARVEVRPTEHLLTVGQSVQLSAVAYSAAGQQLGGRPIAWSSADTSIARVSASGVATARDTGSVLLHATAEGRRGSARVIVRGAGQPAPAPVLQSLSPERATSPMPAPFTLTVTGEGFVPASKIHWDGVARETQYVSARTLRTTVQPMEVSEPTTASVTVVTPAPGGGTSNALVFTAAPQPAPVIVSIDPERITAGWSAFTLTVTGREFVPASRIRWNGVTRETQYVGPNTLRMTVTASDVAQPRTVQVTVITPAPGGGTSNAVTFTVNPVPVASVQLLSPHGAPWTWTGDELTLRARVRDASGRELSAPVQWSTSDTTIARVSSNGLVSGIRAGSARITATAGGVSDDILVAVEPAPAFDLVYDAGSGSQRHIQIWRPDVATWPQVVPLPMPAYDPSPSPDGARIAFAGVDASGNVDIYVASRNGTDLQRLTTHGGIDDQPAWSPDGRTIAFRSNREGYSDVWTMNVDGSGLRRLTLDPTGDDGIRVHGQWNLRPAWSPGSDYIVYSSSSALGDTDLWVMRADGTGKRQLTSGEGDDDEPAWSPDGSEISYRSTQGAAVNVRTVDATTGEFIWRPVNPGSGRTPVYSPDGRWLVFAGPQSAGPQLLAMPANGTVSGRQLLPNDGVGANPAWMRR